MRQRLHGIGVAALATLITLTGCGGPSTENSNNSTAGTTTRSAPAQVHNNADVMFARHMIPHHQQAIQMSDIVLNKQGIDPRVVTLANQIKAAQDPEIQQMQLWLNQWGEPTTMPMPSGSMMPGHDMPGHDVGSMPGMTGMMSEQDMAALQNAQGVEATKLFLTQMIAHHQGAIAMAQNEIKSGQYPPAIAMSQSIVTSQQKEIDEMNAILGTL